MTRTITIGLSPNAENEDVSLAIRNLFKILNYKKGKEVLGLEEWFRQFFKVKSAISFNSGRGALYSILTALNINRNDEVIMQAFTCVVVANSILATGAKPIFADTTKSFVLDPVSVEKKITKKTKAIIVQHTFGIPADMEKIMEISKKYNIPIIEDAAHTIGGEFKKKKLGTFGVASFFSFGRDKAFSSVFGGIVITNNSSLAEKIKSYHRQRRYPSYFWIFQQLLHPIAFSIILPLYDLFNIGKILLVGMQKLHLLSLPVISEEKRGIFHASQVKKMPNILASLALMQLKKLTIYNQRRRKIAARYMQQAEELNLDIPVKKDSIPFLRFPVLFDHPSTVRKYFRDNGNIYLGDWYANIIDPRESNYLAVNYSKGSCKNAESLAKKIVNFPTHPTMTNEDVEKVIEILKNYVAS